ncbi:MAG: CAP domain-containing protein [Chthoniobacteraceae bacterium]
MSRLSLIRTLVASFLVIGAPAVEAQLNSQEQRVATLLANASGQQRPSVQVDPILSKVARARAADMAKRHYFAHVNPDGHGPNYLVRQAGYPLPAGYDQSAAGNNIESAAAGDHTADEAWSGWMGSAPHKKHLLAQDAFYAAQTALGVGYYFDANSEYQHYWVVLTAPPPGPALSILSPAANAGLTVAQASISGTSGGSPAAARVEYRLENAGGVGPITNATGTTAWSALVTGLTPGPNTIRVRSVDAAGSTIKELTRTFRYVVLKPLVVDIEGTGAVPAGFLGTSQRELGVRYSLTAKPAVGWLFDHWSGSMESSSATASFVMVEGFALTAHFRINPFYSLKGAYNGLVQAEEPTHASSGFLKLSMGVTGAFSGRIALGGKAYAFNGKFDRAGAAQVVIRRPQLPSLTLSLTLDLNEGAKQITGTVTDGTFVAALAADQALPAPGKHFAGGRYTISLPPNSTQTSVAAPTSPGAALLVVSAAGVATLSGTLADGRVFTASATVSKDGVLPIYVPLLSGTGSVAGRAIFNAATGALDGTLRWTKPERLTDRYFPAAFATGIEVIGARYVPPKPGVIALTVAAMPGNTALQLSGGDLQNTMQQLATLSSTNVITILDPELPKLVLAITPATGRFTGSFLHPITNATSRISGVILQDRNAAAGFFLGQSASGIAAFAPAP